MPPGSLAARIVARRQRNAGLQPFQFYPRTGAGAQQTVGGFAQCRPALLRILHQSGVEGGEERRDIAVHPGAQLFVDKRAAALVPVRVLAVAAARTVI